MGGGSLGYFINLARARRGGRGAALVDTLQRAQAHSAFSASLNALLGWRGADQVVVRVSARRMAQKCIAARPRAASGAMVAFAVHRERSTLGLNLPAWTTT